MEMTDIFEVTEEELMEEVWNIKTTIEKYPTVSETVAHLNIPVGKVPLRCFLLGRLIERNEQAHAKKATVDLRAIYEND